MKPRHIRDITVFRNDRELATWRYEAPRGDQLAVTFYSESYPYHPQDNPRGWRHWRGTLTVRGPPCASTS